MYIEGFFINGERYRDHFKNEKEFSQCIEQILKNGACELPDIIAVGKRTPKYIGKYIDVEHIIVKEA